MRVGLKVVVAVLVGVVVVEGTAAMMAYNVAADAVEERALAALRGSAFTASLAIHDTVDRHRQFTRAAGELLATLPHGAADDEVQALLRPLAKGASVAASTALLVVAPDERLHAYDGALQRRRIGENADLVELGERRADVAEGVVHVELAPEGLLFSRGEKGWRILVLMENADAFAATAEAFYASGATATLHDASGKVLHSADGALPSVTLGERIAALDGFLLEAGEAFVLDDDGKRLVAVAPVNLRGSYDESSLRVYVATTVSEEIVLAPFRDAATDAGLGGLAVTLVVVGSVAAVTGHLLAPLRSLVIAAEEVGQGRRPDLPRSHRRDEVGSLHNAFRRMIAQLREREAALDRQDSEFDAALESVTSRLTSLFSEDAVAAEAAKEACRLTAAVAARVEVAGRSPAVSGAADAHGERIELPLGPAQDALGSIVLVFAPGQLPPKGADDPRIRILARETAMALAQVRSSRAVEERNAALLKQEKFAALGMLSAGVAHEINNPLAFVSTNDSMALLCIDDALAQPDVPPDARQMLATAREALAPNEQGIQRIRSIVGTLRQFSKPSMRRAELDLNEVVRGGFILSRPKFKDSRRVVEELASGRLAVVGNADELGQVILNLLVNAAEAVGPEGVVTVRSSRTAGGWARIEVEDDGPGVPPPLADRLFHPFFSTKSTGTGLGLSISRRICEDHGGRVVLETPRSGRGAIFAIELPPPELGSTLGLSDASDVSSLPSMVHTRAKGGTDLRPAGATTGDEALSGEPGARP